jgi:hypothetical protein
MKQQGAAKAPVSEGEAMTTGLRGTTSAALLILSLATAHEAHAADPGLVTALDRIGGNLLGPAAFDAVLFDPQPDPPVVRLYLSTAQAQPVEVVLVTEPGEANPPEPVRAFFRMTIGGPAGLKLEYDPNAGDIIPCVVPQDLDVVAAAPLDGTRPGTLRAGLVTALGAVGQDLLGARFAAVLATPPEPVAPQRLRLYVPRSSRLELVLENPPEPVTPWLPGRGRSRGDGAGG